MSAGKNGGPAFPDPGRTQSAKQREVLTDTGMTLRDYFAGQALIRLTGADPDGIHSGEILAMCCYRLADAMLAERTPAPALAVTYEEMAAALREAGRHSLNVLAASQDSWDYVSAAASEKAIHALAARLDAK